MAFRLTSKDYAEYIERAYKVIYDNGDYVTDLDLTTGDGDHWSNLNMGFKKLVEVKTVLETLSISDELKEIGKIMMAVIGGSSGVLYGSAYIAAAKVSVDKEYLDNNGLYEILEAMLDAIMSRGQAKPGFKTMIDSLYPAVEEYKNCLETADSTSNMEAVKGRATYQADKGIGHLDPGAVTMSYQISELMNIAKERII